MRQIQQSLFVSILLFLSATTLHAQPQIKFDSTKFNYGQILLRSNFTGKIEFTNIGNEPLFLFNVNTSSGDMIANWTKDSIFPGKKGLITFRKLTNFLGPFSRSITVHSNSKEDSFVVISIKGEVVQGKKEMAAYDGNDEIDSLILHAPKINFQNLKKLSQTFYSDKHDCDSLSSGTTVELRYCLNIQFQKEDSLLQRKLNELINQENDTAVINQLKLTQEIWERYRYAHCTQYIGKYGYDRMEIFSFLECAIELTRQRREDLDKTYKY